MTDERARLLGLRHGRQVILASRQDHDILAILEAMLPRHGILSHNCRRKPS